MTTMAWWSTRGGHQHPAAPVRAGRGGGARAPALLNLHEQSPDRGHLDRVRRVLQERPHHHRARLHISPLHLPQQRGLRQHPRAAAGEDPGGEGIAFAFEEFKDFCMFLNNLDDFQVAMRMITLTDEPKSQVNPSLAQKQKYFLPNIFTKYFPGGIYQGCPHLRWQTASDQWDRERRREHHSNLMLMSKEEHCEWNTITWYMK